MLGNEAAAASLVLLVPPASQASTFNGAGWTDVRGFEGDLLIIQTVGAITGSITGKLQDATDGSGTSAADVSGATFTVVSAANSILKLVLPRVSVRGWIRYTGTIATGPALVSVMLAARPKIA